MRSLEFSPVPPMQDISWAINLENLSDVSVIHPVWFSDNG